MSQSEKCGGGEKPMKATKVVESLSVKTGLKKTEVKNVLGALSDLAGSELKKGRDFEVPKMVKIKLSDVAAKPARPGRNPATGQTIRLAPKPASKTLRPRTLNPLKRAAGVKPPLASKKKS